MANNHFIASIYRIGNNNLNSALGVPATQGVRISFPSALVEISEITTNGGVTANGVTQNSIIAVLPTGLKVNVVNYYTDGDVGTLNTAAT